MSTEPNTPSDLLALINKAENTLADAMRAYHNSQLWSDESQNYDGTSPTWEEAIDKCFNDLRDYASRPSLSAQAVGDGSPSYEALLIIVQSMCAAFERAGISDCDDPGDVIDLLAADAKRIDWLEDHMAHYGDGYTEPREASISWPGWQQHTPKEPVFPGLRNALDAAMESENERD